MMLKIGITGGLGSGKSIVCQIFSCLKIPVFNADEESKIILDTNQEVKDMLIKHFGADIYSKEGKLDRKRFASIIFFDNDALIKANSIIHPAVWRQYHLWLTEKAEFKYTLKEAAILFESGANKELDFTVLVYAPLNLRIERAIKRDHISKEKIIARIEKQLPDEEKLKLVNYIIYNDNQQAVLPQVLDLHHIFLKKSE
jgi:dephospho-CoA kinase